MNIRWEKGGTDIVAGSFRWYTALDEEGEELFSVCERNNVSHDYTVGGSKKPLTRWCVFHKNQVRGYCGDIPLDLPEEDMKAMAITLWRMRDVA